MESRDASSDSERIPQRRSPARSTRRLKADTIPGRTRRNSQFELSHRRMLRRAVDVIRAEGIAGVTRQRIAHDVEASEADFDAHFESVEHCLGEAAALVVSSIGSIDEQLRGHLSATTLDDRAEHIEVALENWLKERVFVQLALSQRLDPSTFGQCVRPVFEKLRADIAGVLREYLTDLGVPRSRLQEITYLADAVHSQWLWGLEMLIEERCSDRSIVASQMALYIQAVIAQGIRHMSIPSAADVVARRFTPRERADMRTRQQLVAAELRKPPHPDGNARFGGIHPVIDAVMASLSDYFLPEIANGRCTRMLYAIESGGEVHHRLVVIEVGACRWEHADADTPASLTLRAPLRTFLQCMNAVRSYYDAIQAGDLRLEGDTALALELEGWFYTPGSAADRKLGRDD